jgi:hypothetical protein
MRPFLFTVSWDRPLHLGGDRFAYSRSPIEAAWWGADQGLAAHSRGDWRARVPATGTATVTLVPGLFGITDARAAALALVSGLGARQDGVDRLCVDLVAVGGPSKALAAAAHVGVPGLQSLSRTGVSDGVSDVQTLPAATVWLGAEAGVDGALRQDGDRMVGTGILEGSWDLEGFFSPVLALENTAISPSGQDLRGLLSVGGVALALGVVRGWAKQGAFGNVGMDGDPVAFAKPLLTALVAGVLGAHRFDGPGVVRSSKRFDALEGRHAHGFARSYQHRTRVATGKGRMELAGDLVSALLYGLLSTRTLIVDRLPCPTHWRLHPTLVAEMDGTRDTTLGSDMAAAFADGLAIGRAVQHHQGTNALLLAARARGWV